MKELLKDFKGIFFSDFNTGYDSLECDQQKCLVHLIRYLNEDFLKNQLDEEFKNIVTEFGNLLRKIIETIDKYGLKQILLNKHIKDLEKFYSKVVAKEFEYELAFLYKKRLIKYREKLFLFLKFDGFLGTIIMRNTLLNLLLNGERKSVKLLLHKTLRII